MPYSKVSRSKEISKHYLKYKDKYLVYGRKANIKGREERKDWKRRLVELKGGHCVDCGYSAHLVALQFDHLDPSTKIAPIANLINWKASWDVVVEEANKCDLVCANCHAIRTHIRRQTMNSFINKDYKD